MRCLITLLACGWFLMTPPLDTKTKTIRDDLPISRWSHTASFDTATECEKEKSSLSYPWAKAGDRLRFEHYNLARCIPSDTIPLK